MAKSPDKAKRQDREPSRTPDLGAGMRQGSYGSYAAGKVSMAERMKQGTIGGGDKGNSVPKSPGARMMQGPFGKRG